MSIATMDGLIAALAISTLFPWVKAVLPNGANNSQMSLWTAKGVPVAGAIPTTAATCNSALTGSFGYTNPTSPALSYLGHLAYVGTLSSAFIVYDRLSHMGGLDGTNTGVQTVGLSVPDSRDSLSDLSNIEWYVEGYIDLGVTSQTLTITYVNTASATVTTTITIPATLRAGRMLRVFPGATTDVIQSITSCQLGGSTGTAGNFGITCARKLVQAGIATPADADILDFFRSGGAKIPDNSCLWLTVVQLATAVTVHGTLRIFQG